MNLSKSFLIASTLLGSSLFTAVISSGSEPILPPQPPKVIEHLHLPANVERGVVKVRLMIDKSGHARKIAIVSSCDQAIESQVVTAVAKWQFTPATQNGQPVDADVILPLHLIDLSDSGAARL